MTIEIRQANDIAAERQREVDGLKYKVYEVQNNSATRLLIFKVNSP